MADRSVHYEAAFEAYLRERGIPCVAVDEAKRALFASAKLKSFDFVVYSRNGPNMLVDIKGRALTDGKSLQTWSKEQDVIDLMQWEIVFGEGYKAMLVFVFHIDPPLTEEPGMYCFRGRWYQMLGVELLEYRNHMRRRSSKWDTVSVRANDFRSLARPIESWL